MARYIDADAFIKTLEADIKEFGEPDINTQPIAYGSVLGIESALDLAKEFPTADVVPKSEVDKWYYEYHAIKDELKQEKMYHRETEKLVDKYCTELEKANAEIDRLHGILLQFTDIVHKWGAKNNIDTSEISLVPILQEEADSIIKKANQAFAREIFEEIEKLLHSLETPINKYWVLLPNELAELKKKYTE